MIPSTVSEIDWAIWQPTERATLCFVIRAGQIPYHEMWQDDKHWLPLLLARKRFCGCFIFAGEKLLSYLVD